MRIFVCMLLTGCLCDVKLPADPRAESVDPLTCPDRVVRLMSVATDMCFADDDKLGVPGER